MNNGKRGRKEYSPRKKCCVFIDVVSLLVRLRNKSKTHDPRPGTKMPSWRNTADGPFGKVQASSGLPRHKECKRMEKKTQMKVSQMEKKKENRKRRKCGRARWNGWKKEREREDAVARQVGGFCWPEKRRAAGKRVEMP